MGPMAGDFYGSFGVGEDEQHIGTVDADGVSLAAILGMYELVQEQEALISAQGEQIEALKARVEALERAPSDGGAAPGTMALWSALGGLVLSGVGGAGW